MAGVRDSVIEVYEDVARAELALRRDVLRISRVVSDLEAAGGEVPVGGVEDLVLGAGGVPAVEEYDGGGDRYGNESDSVELEMEHADS